MWMQRFMSNCWWPSIGIELDCSHYQGLWRRILLWLLSVTVRWLRPSLKGRMVAISAVSFKNILGSKPATGVGGVGERKADSSMMMISKRSQWDEAQRVWFVVGGFQVDY